MVGMSLAYLHVEHMSTAPMRRLAQVLNPKGRTGNGIRLSARASAEKDIVRPEPSRSQGRAATAIRDRPNPFLLRLRRVRWLGRFAYLAASHILPRGQS